MLDLVSQEGLAKRASARLASLGVNGAGLVVMLGVFMHTGGLTGAEIAVAGGSSALGQRVLEAILGDQAVRTMAERARDDLIARVERLMAGEQDRYGALLEPVTPPGERLAALEQAISDVQRAR